MSGDTPRSFGCLDCPTPCMPTVTAFRPAPPPGRARDRGAPVLLCHPPIPFPPPARREARV